MAFSSDLKELVRSRTELVSLVAESLTLIPRSGHFVGLCPFHDDKNPSMVVYPDRQSFKCWSCQEGGDAFTWVMKRENLSFPEALKILADRAHIELPKFSDKDAEDNRQKSNLYEVLKWAELQFHDYFLKSTDADAEVAREYVRKRGYTDETIKRFRLGYHPTDWEWIQRRAQKTFGMEQLVDARLVGERDNSAGHYDYFVDRVLWPIHDERARTVAFGGRVIPGRERPNSGKYFNSPESAVFHKSKILYGLPEARDAIGKEKTVLVVEGYADCVACHQYGVQNTVATLGTALTDIQCSRLKAFAPKIVLSFDADDAGQNAAAKAVGMLLGQSVDLRVLSIPQGKDPDEFLKANGAEAFRELIRNAQEAWEFRLDWEAKTKGADGVNGREQILTAMLGLLATVPNLEGSSREALILGRVASRLRLPETEVRNQLQQFRIKGAAARPVRIAQPVEDDAAPRRVIAFHKKTMLKDDKLESEFLEVLFVQPQLAEVAQREIGVADFLNEHLRELLNVIYDLLELGEEPTLERVTLHLEDNDLKSLAIWISDQAGLKNIEKKLGEIENGEPKLFRQNVTHLKWRREELAHQAYLNREVLQSGISTEDPLARLRRASQFHQKRATKTVLDQFGQPSSRRTKRTGDQLGEQTKEPS